MRLRTILSACFLMLPAFGAAQTQTYLGEHELEPRSIVRPASTTVWRNYVTVPDGPCGYPMAVQADCYNPSTRPCGPLHPICFSKRVVRMLDCVIPCNLCCSGGCHGGGLGGRTWGHCSMCCGGGACGAGGCNGWGGAGPSGGCGSCNSGCCTNPAGSVFDSVPCCTTGGNCHGCSATTPSCSDTTAPPMLNDPFKDDPLPAPPKPISTPSTEVRRVPTNRTKPVSTAARSNMAQAAPAQPASNNSAVAKTTAAKSTQPRTTPARETSVLAAAPAANRSVATSPYKIVSQPATASVFAPTAPQTMRPRNSVSAAPASDEPAPVIPASVLRRASAETTAAEPALLSINHARTQPIIPDYYDTSAPSNPLR